MEPTANYGLVLRQDSKELREAKKLGFSLDQQYKQSFIPLSPTVCQLANTTGKGTFL